MSSKTSQSSKSKDASGKTKKQEQTHTTREQLKLILGDVGYVYKHFFHWNLSKVSYSAMTFFLGILMALPFAIIAVLVGYFDPIQWQEVGKIFIDGGHIELNVFQQFISHPFWALAMGIFILFAMTGFFLGASYGSFLIARLSNKYIDRKLPNITSAPYFYRDYIQTYIGILFWIALYMFIPLVGAAIFLGILGSIFAGGAFIARTFMILGLIGAVLGVIYCAYRLIFGYIILAATKKKDTLHSARYYVQQSIKATSGKYFGKFLLVGACFIIATIPVRYIGNYLEGEIDDMGNAYVYNSGVLQGIPESDQRYYKFISEKYTDVSQQDLLDKIQLYRVLQFVYIVASYMILTGIGTMILVSFYRRVLLDE